jgi:hypothetical protein
MGSGSLNDMLKEARGSEAVCTIKNGKDRRGQAETKLSNFRELPEETPPVLIWVNFRPLTGIRRGARL